MAYATVQDLVDYAGEAMVARLSTPDGAELSGVWAERVQPRLDAASDLMDSYFRRRYLVPVPTSPIITECCCALARYELASASPGPATSIAVTRKSYLNWLADIGTGKVTLDGAALSGPVDGARVSDRAAMLHKSGPLF